MPKKLLNVRPKSFNLDTRLKKRPLIFYDLEFSGLEMQHEIIQIGGLVVDQETMEIVNEWGAKIKPRHIKNADQNSLDIVGYDPEHWKKAISLKDALNKFNDIAKKGVLIGYNSSWDFLFLKKSYDDLKIKPKFHWQTLDVLSMAFAFLYNSKKIKGFRMTEVADYFELKNENWHDALADARITYEIFLKLLEGEHKI